MGYLGEILLAVVFLLCCFAAVFGAAALKLQTETARKALFWARRAALVAAGLSVVALVLLIAAFVGDDFSIAAVGRYSSAKLPFFYKLSAVWAGSAGSLLLWSAGVFALFGLWLAKTETDEVRFASAALSIGSGVCCGFSALLVFVAKPFAGCLMTIDNGAGLNPLLRNLWMVIHPPLLFLGYSAFSIAFVIVLASVFAGRMTDFGFYRQLRRWLLAGICFLGLGIATGARWSYVELGWGGYWAWDPVENASLLPWLVAVAALHSLSGARLAGPVGLPEIQSPIADKFRLWTVVLGPVPFILSLVATFITRSGILQSVHSFAGDAMFSALLVFIACCFLLWMACIIRAAKVVSIIVRPAQRIAARLDKGEMLSLSGAVLVLTAVVIATATFWPIVSSAITGSHPGITLRRLFYDRVISGAGIILAFLVGLGALADLQKRHSFTLQLLGCCGVGLVCFELTYRFSEEKLLAGLACGICAFSSVAILIRLLFSLRAGGRIGGQIAHLGLLLLVVSAGFSSNEQSGQTQLAKGGKFILGNYEFVYDSFEHQSSDGLTKVGPEITVRKKGLLKKLWPHNNLYPGGQSTSEVAVHTGLLEDIYISFDGVTMDGRVVVTAKIKPLMLWLWFAVLLIVAGSGLVMLEGRR